MKLQMKPGTNPTVTVSAGSTFTRTFSRGSAVDVRALAEERVGECPVAPQGSPEGDQQALESAWQNRIAEETKRLAAILLDSGEFEAVAGNGV